MADDTIIASAAPVEHPPTEHGHKVPSSDTEINPEAGVGHSLLDERAEGYRPGSA